MSIQYTYHLIRQEDGEISTYSSVSNNGMVHFKAYCGAEVDSYSRLQGHKLKNSTNIEGEASDVEDVLNPQLFTKHQHMVNCEECLMEIGLQTLKDVEIA